MNAAFNGVLRNVCVITLGATGFLCSCKATHEQPGPIVINDFGTWQCFTNLGVAVDKSDRQVQITYSRRGSTFTVTNVQTSTGWVVADGWFVLPEDEDRVWIYTGSKLHLLVLDTQGNSWYYCERFPVQVPDAVRRELHKRDRNL